MRHSTPSILILGLLSAAPAIASPDRAGGSSAPAFRASYDAGRGVYCIRFYADGDAADPRPNVSGTTCRSKVDWARRGVTISHRARQRAAGS